MKFKAIWIAGLMLAAAAGQVQAGMVYTSGAINGTHTGYAISGGYAVSNSFSLSISTTLTGATAGIWVAPGDEPTSVEWSIGTSQFGSDVASGTSTLTNTYFGQYGSYYNIYESAISLSASVSAGTYWLTLQHAVAPSIFVYWDVNQGTSTAFQKSINGDENPVQSNSLALFGDSAPVPEPASIAMWSLGALGLMFARRKRQRMKLTA